MVYTYSSFGALEFERQIAGLVTGAPLALSQGAALSGCAGDDDDHDRGRGQDVVQVDLGDVVLVRDALYRACIVHRVRDHRLELGELGLIVVSNELLRKKRWIKNRWLVLMRQNLLRIKLERS